VKAGVLRTEAQARFEVERGRRTWIQIAAEAWDMDRRRGGPLLAGGLAYRMFLWMLPFALFLASVVMIFTDTQGDPAQTVAKTVGFTGAVAALVGEAARQTGSSAWWLAAVGLVVSLWAARGLARAVLLTNRIAWALPPPTARAGTRAGLTVWGVLLVGSALQGLRPLLFKGGLRSDLMAQIVLFAFLFAVVASAMSMLPRRGPWTVVLAGAALLAVGLRAMAIGTAVYFADQLNETATPYAGLGIAITILLYLFIMCRLFVWAEFLNARIGGVRLVVGEPGDEGAPLDSGA
jgi:uncharacterized BrkB/YihY/UPF0761 family membrane protein